MQVKDTYHENQLLKKRDLAPEWSVDGALR